jgi:hypothetical protein
MTRRRGLGWLATAVICATFCAACGGDDGPTQSDAAMIKTMLSSSSAVQGSFSELYTCLPEERACYSDNGPDALTTVRTQRSQFTEALEDTDNSCLRDVGELYLASLDGYEDAAEAAVAVDPSAFDEAISGTTEDEIAYNRKLTDCGFTEGRTAEIGAAIREVNIELLRLSEEIGDCLRPKCIRDVARRMEDSSAEGVGLLEDYREALEEAPDCLVAAVDKFLDSFQTLGSAARAIQQNDFTTAQQDGTRADQLALEAQADMAACLESLGA